MADRLLRDLWYTVRVLVRNAGFTRLAVAAMSLGIASATLIFSIVNATLFQSLPYRDADRLMLVWDSLTKAGILQFPTTTGIFRDYRERNRSFEQLEAFAPYTAT